MGEVIWWIDKSRDRDRSTIYPWHIFCVFTCFFCRFDSRLFFSPFFFFRCFLTLFFISCPPFFSLSFFGSLEVYASFYGVRVCTCVCLCFCVFRVLYLLYNFWGALRASRVALMKQKHTITHQRPHHQHQKHQRQRRTPPPRVRAGRCVAVCSMPIYASAARCICRQAMFC